ncbi:MAG TPA: L-threonylcarbamoyladenylate synthase [Anaerolineales bacterium]|nr:L-threonylcarbamoyladenylate synthase [Anaerolineales bacterium]
MNTEVLDVNAPRSIQRALEILQAGGLVAFPTDTVYGVGAQAFDGKAVESIYKAKARPLEKAIPVLIGDVEDINQVASEVPLMAKKLAARFWPGPLTLIVPKRINVPDSVSAAGTVGVRVPDHAAARRLLRAAGPMGVTSANLSGKPSPSTAEEVFSQLNGRIPLILDGGKTPGGIASTVVDCTGTNPIIVRDGPIAADELAAIIRQ